MTQNTEGKMTLKKAMQQIRPVSSEAKKAARLRWDQVAKPLNSLGILEEDLVRIAGAQNSEAVCLDQKWIAVMCADNGIVEEGVTQTGQEVTAVVAANMARGASCVCLMAAKAGAKVLPVDVGIASDMEGTGILNRKIRYGTRNFLKEPAMTREETVKAMETGMEAAGILKEKGCRLAGCGEMGIGNTTTSSAVLSVLLGKEPEEVTGRGAGLSDEALNRKIRVIREGISLRQPDPEDAIDVLSKVGGLDLAALAGFYIGCACYRIPVVLDGLITAAAALAAVKLSPAVRDYLLASHVSAEPAGAMALKALGLKAVIHGEMCLGEGTGAAALFPLLDMAASVYGQMESFEEIHVEQYRRFGKEEEE